MVRRWPIFLMSFGVVGVVLLLLWLTGWLAMLWQALTFDSIDNVAAYLRGFGFWTPLMSVLLMVGQAVIAPLPGSLVAAANGIVYGIWWGTLLSWVGGLTGAAVTYGLGRWLEQRLPASWVGAKPLQQLDQLAAAHGFWVVLIARLTPIISLDGIGYLAGISRMPFRRYMLASAIGMAPGMFAYTVLGHDLTQANQATWRIGLVLAGLVLLFLLGRWLLQRRGLIGARGTMSEER